MAKCVFVLMTHFQIQWHLQELNLIRNGFGILSLIAIVLKINLQSLGKSFHDSERMIFYTVLSFCRPFGNTYLDKQGKRTF